VVITVEDILHPTWGVNGSFPNRTEAIEREAALRSSAVSALAVRLFPGHVILTTADGRRRGGRSTKARSTPSASGQPLGASSVIFVHGALADSRVAALVFQRAPATT